MQEPEQADLMGTVATKLRASPSLSLILVTALTVFLAGCGSSLQDAWLEDSAGQYDQTSHLLTVEIPHDAELAAVERLHRGKAIVWKPGDFAVLTVNALTCQECGLTTQSKSPVLTDLSDSAIAGGGKIVEMNGTSRIWSGGTSRIWSGGTSRIWSGGSSTVWDGGTSRLWSGGSFTWMPENSELWAQVGLESAHGIASNLGLGVKVAVIDSGVDIHHPALREALAPEDEWRDFYDGDSVPQEEGELFVDDGYGHGTSVAGIIRQVAPRATILPLRVLGPDGQGSAADVVRAIVWAVDQGADVINLSLGAKSHINAIDAALRYATDRGVIVTASTGDTTFGDKKVTYPASRSHLGPAAPYLLSVTSVDRLDAKSWFATHHQTKVEIAAPGENVLSPAPDSRKVGWSGTSMSAPMAAGALALALGQELALPADQLTAVLMQTSADIYGNDLNDEFIGELGEGRLDIAKFLLQTVTAATGGE